MCGPGWTFETRWHHWSQKTTEAIWDCRPFETSAIWVQRHSTAVISTFELYGVMAAQTLLQCSFGNPHNYLIPKTDSGTAPRCVKGDLSKRVNHIESNLDTRGTHRHDKYRIFPNISTACLDQFLRLTIIKNIKLLNSYYGENGVNTIRKQQITQ